MHTLYLCSCRMVTTVSCPTWWDLMQTQCVIDLFYYYHLYNLNHLTLSAIKVYQGCQTQCGGFGFGNLRNDEETKMMASQYTKNDFLFVYITKTRQNMPMGKRKATKAIIHKREKFKKIMIEAKNSSWPTCLFSISNSLQSGPSFLICPVARGIGTILYLQSSSCYNLYDCMMPGLTPMLYTN